MSRFRVVRLIALALLVSLSSPAFADNIVEPVDPIRGRTCATTPVDLGTVDSGEPDIGQHGKKSVIGGEPTETISVSMVVRAFRWGRVIWSTRYLGIGF